MMIIGWLARFVAGGAFKAILGEIAGAQARKLDAKNASERIEADKEIAQLEARAQVLQAEAQDAINRWFRAFIAIGPAIYVFSYFAIDKVACVKFGLDGAMCRVDGIDDPIMQGVMAAVLGFYLLTRTKR